LVANDRFVGPDVVNDLACQERDSRPGQALRQGHGPSAYAIIHRFWLCARRVRARLKWNAHHHSGFRQAGERM
jgi:hypothetical protein